MRTTGTAEFFYGQRLITRIKQNAVNKRRRGNSLVDGFRASHVNHLHQRNSRQLFAQVCVAARFESIANLNRIYAQASLLVNDRYDVLVTREQKRSDCGWNGRGNLGN